jgi:hypothetical protein
MQASSTAGGAANRAGKHRRRWGRRRRPCGASFGASHLLRSGGGGGGRKEVRGIKQLAYASLHSGERSSTLFLRMHAGLLVLHLGSMHKGLCTLPNNGELHYTSLDRLYAAYQTPPV